MVGLKAAAPAAHIQHEKLGNPHRKPYPCVMKTKMTSTALRSETATIVRLKAEPSTSVGVGKTLCQLVNFAVALDPNNPNRAIITWDKVVYRNCGGGPELILTQPESMFINYPYYRGTATATYQACEEIISKYDVTILWKQGIPGFHPPANGNPQVPYEVDYQQPITCTEQVTLSQMVCPPLCGPGFDQPDPDGDGCPDGTVITTDQNQLGTAFQQAANNGSGSLSLPNHFSNVRFSDGSTRVVLDNELSLIDDCIDVMNTVPIGGSLNEYFHVELPTGGGSATLQNVLDLRASGVMMEVTAPTAADLPPGSDPNTDIHTPAIPEFTFFIYDHLGNTRVMYHNEMYDCEPFHTHYVLEHVLDYYPYGKTLREYVLDRERFETTYHERDVESGLDYRGARFYDGEIGRFLSVDPAATNYPGWSFYNYVLGNPINLVDPDGRNTVEVDGEIVTGSEARWALRKNPNEEEDDYIYDEQEDGSWKRREGVENDGGENFHTYNHKDGKISYYRVNEKSLVTVDPKEIERKRTKGWGYQLGLSGAAGAPWGLSGGLGIAWDSKGNVNPYGSLGFFHGLDLSIGGGFTATTSADPNFSINSFKGLGVSYDLGLGPLGFGHGFNTTGNGNYFQKTNNTYQSYSLGLSAGRFPLTFRRTIDYTWVGSLFSN